MAKQHKLLLKAESIAAAARHVDAHLSIPAGLGTLLGYGEVMVSVEGDDLTEKLQTWHTESRPTDGPYEDGALIWFE